MKASEALKKADKIIPTHREEGKFSGICARIGVNGVLVWCGIESGNYIKVVSLEDIEKHNWQPCYEEKEIRPEKAEELWKSPHGTLLLTSKFNNELYVTINRGPVYALENYQDSQGKDYLISNRNGWERIFPLVPNKNIERIEANVSFTNFKSREFTGVVAINGGASNVDNIVDFLVNKSKNGRLFLEVLK